MYVFFKVMTVRGRYSLATGTDTLYYRVRYTLPQAQYISTGSDSEMQMVMKDFVNKSGLSIVYT